MIEKVLDLILLTQEPQTKRVKLVYQPLNYMVWIRMFMKDLARETANQLEADQVKASRELKELQYQDSILIL
jgi:hypothetical protein